MNARKAEQVSVLPEPQPLGVEIDPESAALFDDFAQRRNLDQVYELWKDPQVTNPTIRQRAVTVLTAPHGYDAPFPHPDQSIARFLNISEEVDGEQTTSLRARLNGRTELAEEASKGIMYWLETAGEEIEDDRYAYINAIRELLPIVSEEIADELFSHFPIKDPVPYANMPSASDYDPLINVLYDEEVPRKYKESGIAQWIKIAEHEETGVLRPRTEHERATSHMALFIELQSLNANADDEICTTLVAALEEHMPKSYKTYVRPTYARHVADHITDEDVRFNFAWRHLKSPVSREWDKFRAKNEKDIVFLEWVREEARGRGVLDKSFLNEVKDSKLNVERIRREEIARNAAETALQAQLRAK